MTKSLLFYILRTVGIILVCTFLLDRAMYFTLKGLNEKVLTGQKIGKLNKFMVIKDSIDVVVFGSSRANRHVDVSKLSESSFNMGLDGKSFAFFSTLVKLLPTQRRQLVIVNIDNKNLFDKEYDGKDIVDLMSRYRSNEVIRKEIDRLNMSGSFSSFLWSLDYNQKVFPILSNLFIDNYTYNGFDPLLVSLEEKKVFAKSLRNKVVGCNKETTPSPIALDRLAEIRQFCAQNNKILIALITPVYDFDACPEDFERTKTILDSLNIELLDYSGFFSKDSSLDLWKDASHLSENGADIFSAAFAAQLKKDHHL